MGSIDAPRRWEGWVEEALTEKRPASVEMTDTERLDFLGEYCEKLEYEAKHYKITDCLGQRTVEANFRDAIDVAAAKYKEANE